jgi:hypothetical protein
MMDEVAKKFPDIVRVIAYEDMIADPRRALTEVAELCGVKMPDGDLPELGDDRGAAAPYQELMDAVLSAS